MADVLVPLAQGCEELEAVTVIDLLRRADIHVTTAGLDQHSVKASRGVVLIPDTTLDKVLAQPFDMIVLPGGLPGADNLAQDNRIQQILLKTLEQGGMVAAICAAPRVLVRAGLLPGKRITSYPGTLDHMALDGINLTQDAIVVDGQIVTSRSPGTAMDFALALIEKLAGSNKRKEVEAGLVR
ncbi:MAG: DJ-1/PfpI family protein [Gammaproteobacteria bacterium]|nr:DJ-1/PfpI family protein [Gammaproteobacteria bacterium]